MRYFILIFTLFLAFLQNHDLHAEARRVEGAQMGATNSCEWSQDCPFGLCIQGSCREMLRPHQPCRTADQCASRVCTNGACGKEREKCNDESPCGFKSYCSEGSCKPLPGEGEACRNGPGGCTPGLVCMIDLLLNPICRSPITEDKKCQPGETCDYGLACMGGVCKPWLEPGKKCGDNFSCSTGNCVNGVCETRIDEDACGANRHCASGQCLNNRCVPIMAGEK